MDIPLAVNGTLMRGLELNANLTAAGAHFVREAATAPEYRLWSIGDRHPAMLRASERGAARDHDVRWPRVDETDVERLAAHIGLTIPPGSRAAVAHHLVALLLLAAVRVVEEFPLPETTEPAWRFEP